MFYYVLENGVVNVYTAKGLGPVLKTYNFDEVTGDNFIGWHVDASRNGF